MNYIDDFKVDLEYVRNYSPNTVKAYISDLTFFNEYIKKDISKVSSSDIEKYIKTLDKKSPKSIARVITSMRMFYDYLIRTKVIKVNPMDAINGPKIPKYLPDVLTIDEVDRLLDMDTSNPFKFRDKCILELLYSSGLRISELVNLKFENINLDDCFVKVMGKGSKERIVPLNDITCDFLREYLDSVRPRMIKKSVNDYIFLNNHGKNLTRQAVFKMIKKRCEDSGINKSISPHTLRHSFATHMLQNGADIRFIQELLGHSDVQTTEIYTHIVNENLKRDYNELNPRDN